MKTRQYILIIFLLIVTPFKSMGQNYILHTVSINGGSGLSSSSSYVNSLTSGQPMTGGGNSENFSTGTGFWFQVQGVVENNTFSFSMSDGWNIVSVPRMVSDYSKTNLFPTATSHAFAYNNGYLHDDTLRNGKGYWLKFDGTQSFSLIGFPIAIDSIPVVERWNLIGSISRPIAVQNILSVPRGLVTSQFWGYDSGYIQSDTLKPGNGYWVKASQDGQLILSSVVSSQSSVNKIKIITSTELPPSPPENDGKVSETRNPKPETFSLEQNYPNPFNPLTVIRYQLPVKSTVTLKVFDVLGREVAVLVENEVKDAGEYQEVFDASHLLSGIYFYRLKTGEYVQTRKLVLLH